MPDIEPLDPSLFASEPQCFGCGPDHPTGLRLRMVREGDEVVTRFTPRKGLDGPPGIVHGGLQATIADEVGAWAIVGLKKRFGFTTSMSLRYYRPARTHLIIEARARIISEHNGLYTVQVTLRQAGQRVLSGRIGYAVPTESTAEAILQQPIPQAWKPLCRPSS